MLAANRQYRTAEMDGDCQHGVGKGPAKPVAAVLCSVLRAGGMKPLKRRLTASLGAACPKAGIVRGIRFYGLRVWDLGKG